MSAPAGKINAIKAALVSKFTAAQSELGVKAIHKDISPQDIVEAMKLELPYFPALLVNYAGRLPSREGSSVGGALKTDPTYAVLVADRDLSGPYVSGETAIDLCEAIVELVDGQRFAPAQKGPFEFAGDQLMYQDASLVIYQLLFRTQTVHQRRL